MTISSTGGSGGTSNYSELTNKPSINNVTLSGNKTTSDLGINIPDVSNFITKDVNNLTYYTLATGTGSTIELSINSSTYVMTLNLKNSAGTTISTDTIDLPLETMVVGGSYDDQTKKIILTLKNGETVEFSVADLVSGLQSEITSNNKLSSDLVDDTDNTNKFVTASDKSTWNGKQDALVSGTNIKTINNTSILGSGNINIDCNLKMLDISSNSSSNPIILENMELGTYVLYFKNTSEPEERTVYIKNKSTHSEQVLYYIKNGSMLNYYKKISDVTNTYESIGYVQIINFSGTTPYISTINLRCSNLTQGYLKLDTNQSNLIGGNNKSSIGSNYSSSKIQLLENVNGTIKWVDNADAIVIYLGKISNYDTSAKALDISNYKANTRILLKHNDSTRSMYIKFK